MSLSVPDTTSVAGVTTNIPGLQASDIPADVRTGNGAAKQAYGEGLAFEQILVNQLVQTMSSDISDGGDATDSSGGSLNQTGLLAGDGSSTNVYSGMMTQALSSSLMSTGGLGIASELAQAIDPSIDTSAAAAAASGSDGGAAVSGGAVSE
jgi:Rod binding domain-containing protein